MDYHFILYQVEQGVARITLNRPDVLNSFHREMGLEMQNAITQVNNDNSVRCVLLTGTGRAFCAGQDLDEVSKKDNVDLGEIVRNRYNPIIRGIRHTEKPFVCAVNGIAAGAGANMALACDIVIASAQASFVQSFCQVGLVPDSGGTFFLPRMIGLPRATALMMLGEKLKATRALEIGMIYQVCDPDALLDEAFKMACDLATKPTTGLGLMKRAINQSLASALDSQLALEGELQSLAGQTDDYKEGVKAFLEKRKPNFIGT